VPDTIYLPTRPVWKRTGTTSTTPAVVYIPASVRQVKVWVDADSYVAFGTTYAAPSVTGVDEVYTITTDGTVADGYFTLVFDGEETGQLTFDESAADVVTALDALANVASGDFTGGGGALPTAITLTAGGVYDASGPLPLLTVGDNNLYAAVQQRLLLALAWNVTTPASNSPNVNVRRSTHGTGTGNTAGGYGYVLADTQEVFDLNKDPWVSQEKSRAGRARYMYVATVASTGNYQISGYLLA
jgi:hypothetical protein